MGIPTSKFPRCLVIMCGLWQPSRVLGPRHLVPELPYGWGSQRIQRQAWVNLGNMLIDYMLPFDRKETYYNIL